MYQPKNLKELNVFLDDGNHKICGIMIANPNSPNELEVKEMINYTRKKEQYDTLSRLTGNDWHIFWLGYDEENGEFNLDLFGKFQKDWKGDKEIFNESLSLTIYHLNDKKINHETEYIQFYLPNYHSRKNREIFNHIPLITEIINIATPWERNSWKKIKKLVMDSNFSNLKKKRNEGIVDSAKKIIAPFVDAVIVVVFEAGVKFIFEMLINT